MCGDIVTVSWDCTLEFRLNPVTRSDAAMVLKLHSRSSCLRTTPLALGEWFRESIEKPDTMLDV